MKAKIHKRLIQRYGDNAGPIIWNPFNKVVQDHRDGMIHLGPTNKVRKFLGMPVPWTPQLANEDVKTGPVFLEERVPMVIDASEVEG
jgi:hypothetical protein